MADGQRDRLGATAAAGLCLVAAVLLYHIPLADTVAGDALHAALAAAAALVCLALAGGLRAKCGRVGRAAWALGAVGLCLLAALASVTVPMALGYEPAAFDLADKAFLLLVVTLSCAATAVWEEVAFRGLGQDAVQDALGEGRGAALKAACVCSAVFAILHMGQTGDAGQTALRFVQVFLFGLAMAGLRFGARGLVWPIAVHALYDLVCFVPASLAWQGDGWEMPASALSSVETSVSGIAASLVFLLPAAVLACRGLAGEAK